MKTETTKPNPLTRDNALQAARAITRVAELKAKSLALTTNETTELSGLESFLARFFSTHGAEILECWFIATDEYKPVVALFAMLQLRSRNFLAAREKSYQAETPPQMEDKQNV